MIRLNFFVIVGAVLVVAGTIMSVVGVLEGGLSGLVSSFSLFGAMLPSLLSIIVGLALIKIGMKPKGFARRRYSKTHHQKS